LTDWVEDDRTTVSAGLNPRTERAKPLRGYGP
jgi:hypothetical protein